MIAPQPTTTTAPQPHRWRSQQQQGTNPDFLENRQRRRRRRGSRLWQLPKSNIQEYAKWIEEKPTSEQSVSERKFLWKFQRRCHLKQHKLPSESMKEYIDRLEAKEDERTPLEIRLIAQFYHKQAARRAERQGKGVVPPPIFWRRNAKPAPETAAPSVLATMASLKESMDRMGLSSDKLRTIRMDDRNMDADH